VFVPEGFPDFECVMCGECCRHRASVVVPPAKARRLEQVLRETGFRFPVRDALMRDENDPAAPVAFAHVGEQCVFLNETNRCHLCDIGVPELRGIWCMAFPVTPIATPRGTDCSISFACPRTARLLRAKEPLNILALTLANGPLPSTGRPFSARHRIPTVAGRPHLDWSGFRLVERMLLAVARDWDLNVSRRLVLLPMMLNRLLAGTEGPESNEALRARASQAARELPAMVQELGTVRPDPVAHYAALASVFSRRIGVRTQASLRKRIDEAVRLVQGRRTRGAAGEFADTLARLYKEHYKPRARCFEHVLGNYVICRLFANREMLAGGVYKGVYTVIYLVAMIRFLATAAVAAGGGKVGQKNLLEAVQFVERLLAQSRNLFDFLDAPGEQTRMLDPACVAALARIQGVRAASLNVNAK